MRSLLRAIIARMTKYVQIDPYANAYTLDYRVWEQKFELDSLAYPTALAWSYWKTTGDTSHLQRRLLDKMLDDVLVTMQREQDHPRDSRYSHKELPNDGAGRPVGLYRDDLDRFPPLRRRLLLQLPDPLGDVRRRWRWATWPTSSSTSTITSSRRARRGRCSGEVQRGIQTYGFVLVPKYGYIYAYEVDGLGHAILTDDANIPSLLAAPYFGYTSR